MTWALIEDLYARFGDEYVDKLAVRRKWDETIQDYVADQSEEARTEVLELALEDAKALILQKLSCLFSGLENLETSDFPAIKIWHIKMTIEVLKKGGDCTACDCAALDEFLKCGSVCTEDGVCLSKKSTFITVSDSQFPCECFPKGCCSC